MEAPLHGGHSTLGGEPHVGGHVSYVKLALDFEVHMGKALLARGDHRLRGVTLPLRMRSHLLRQALDRLQPHM